MLKPNYTEIHGIKSPPKTPRPPKPPSQYIGSKDEKLLSKLKHYEKALQEIAEANNNISRASCPRIARDALYNKEERVNE